MTERKSQTPVRNDFRPAFGNWARPGLLVYSLRQERIRRAKISSASRAVPTRAMRTIIASCLVPQAGDLVLVRVDRFRGRAGDAEQARDPLGGPNPVSLRQGDEVVLCYGSGAGTAHPGSRVPPDLEPCQIVDARGLAGLLPESSSMFRSTTEVTPLGLIGDSAGRVINLNAWAGDSDSPSTLPLLCMPTRDRSGAPCHAA